MPKLKLAFTILRKKGKELVLAAVGQCEREKQEDVHGRIVSVENKGNQYKETRE